MEFEHFFCLLTKKVRVSKKRPTNIEKIGGKICRKIVFSNHFRTSSTEVWTIKQKKFTQDCQNYVQRLQRNNFGTFLWNEGNLLKIFGPRWAKLFDFWREKFGKFVKKAAYVSSGTFEGFFWREMELFDRFRSLNQSIQLLEKNFWKGCQKDFSLVLNKTLRKNDKSNLYYYHLL